MSGIPRIDLTSWHDATGTPEARAVVAKALDAAAADIGFFYVHLEGVAEAATRLLQRCREFHLLPDETKMLVSSKLSSLHRGYNATRQTGGGVVSAAKGDDPTDLKEVSMLGRGRLVADALR